MKRNFIAVVIANAVVWGLVIIACSLALKGTGAYAEIQHFLGGGAAVTTVIILGGMLPGMLPKKETEQQEKEN